MHQNAMVQNLIFPFEMLVVISGYHYFSDKPISFNPGLINPRLFNWGVPLSTILWLGKYTRVFPGHLQWMPETTRQLLDVKSVQAAFGCLGDLVGWNKGQVGKTWGDSLSPWLKASYNGIIPLVGQPHYRVTNHLRFAGWSSKLKKSGNDQTRPIAIPFHSPYWVHLKQGGFHWGILGVC